MLAGTVPLAMLAVLTASCDAMHESVDFERHSFSQLSKPLEGGDFFWFDVRLTAELPADSESAEALRMQWLEAWLEQRYACPNGYSIAERREFGFLEHNPARYDLRYKVRCLPPPAGGAS